VFKFLLKNTVCIYAVVCNAAVTLLKFAQLLINVSVCFLWVVVWHYMTSWYKNFFKIYPYPYFLAAATGSTEIFFMSSQHCQASHQLIYQSKNSHLMQWFTQWNLTHPILKIPSLETNKLADMVMFCTKTGVRQ